MNDADRAALIESARRIGADPVDLATVISYETRGTFSPSVRGGAGNRHIGLIQFGIPEQRQYGASQSQSFAEQLPAVERYLTHRGFKPGMGRLDLYSTINAGRPGLYGASDAGNGGAPGSVADKVRDQMGGHEKKALAFLGGDFKPSMPGEASVPAGRAPFGLSGPVASSSAAPTMPEAGVTDATEKANDGTQVAEILKALMAGGGALQAAQMQAAPAMSAPGRLAPDPMPRPSAFDASRFFAQLR